MRIDMKRKDIDKKKYKIPKASVKLDFDKIAPLKTWRKINKVSVLIDKDKSCRVWLGEKELKPEQFEIFNGIVRIHP